jgi:cation transport ATPase
MMPGSEASQVKRSRGPLCRTVAVLVVAMPCPLILAAPVALVSGLSAAARRGIVVKNGGVLERLARCTTRAAGQDRDAHRRP